MKKRRKIKVTSVTPTEKSELPPAVLYYPNGVPLETESSRTAILESRTSDQYSILRSEVQLPILALYQRRIRQIIMLHLWGRHLTLKSSLYLASTFLFVDTFLTLDWKLRNRSVHETQSEFEIVSCSG